MDVNTFVSSVYIFPKIDSDFNILFLKKNSIP